MLLQKVQWLLEKLKTKFKLRGDIFLNCYNIFMGRELTVEKNLFFMVLDEATTPFKVKTKKKPKKRRKPSKVKRQTSR